MYQSKSHLRSLSSMPPPPPPVRSTAQVAAAPTQAVPTPTATPAPPAAPATPTPPLPQTPTSPAPAEAPPRTETRQRGISCRGLPADDREALIFWTVNAFQHAEALIDFYDRSRARIDPYFSNALTEIGQSFRSLLTRIQESEGTGELRARIGEFISINFEFVEILNRLKFEGLNGYPYLMQILYHILYEQRYANDRFSFSSASSQNDFQNTGLPAINCLYGALYFWSLIAAEHPAILLAIEPFSTALTGDVREEMVRLINAYNRINYQLTSLGNLLTVENLLPILTDFQKQNASFLSLLGRIRQKDRSLYATVEPPVLPPVFDLLLEHFTDEQELMDSIGFEEQG